MCAHSRNSCGPLASRMNLMGDRPLTADERRLVLRFGVVIAIPMAFIVLATVVVGFLLYRHTANDRIADTKAAIQREADVRIDALAGVRKLAIHFNNVQEWIQFDNCVADEKQDAVIVSILRSIPVSERTPVIQEGIDALEPHQGDRVCVPPLGQRPNEARP